MDLMTDGAKRVLLYSQDGLGLGHLRRTSVIASSLVAERSGTTVLTIVDSPLGPFFRRGPGEDCIKLPSIVKLKPGVWQPVGVDRPFQEVLALRRDLLCTIGTSFRPDLFLVDHMPHGAVGELVPMLHAMRALPDPPRCVLGLRDIVDAPDVVRRVWAEEGAFAALDECYDDVLVYGRRDVFDPVREYAFPPSVAERVHFTGYVCTPEPGRYAGSVRARSTSPGSRLLVAMAGGGADAFPMMTAVLDAMQVLASVGPWSAVLITGPFMPADQRRELERRASRLGARVRPEVSDPQSYVEAADVIVTMAGYGSSVEATRSGRPTVLVPRRGPSAEQQMRASRFAERQWASWVDPEALSGQSVALAVLSQLGDGPRPEPLPADGLDATVRLLGAMLDEERSPLRSPGLSGTDRVLTG